MGMKIVIYFKTLRFKKLIKKRINRCNCWRLKSLIEDNLVWILVWALLFIIAPNFKQKH